MCGEENMTHSQEGYFYRGFHSVFDCKPLTTSPNQTLCIYWAFASKNAPKPVQTKPVHHYGDVPKTYRPLHRRQFCPSLRHSLPPSLHPSLRTQAKSAPWALPHPGCRFASASPQICLHHRQRADSPNDRARRGRGGRNTSLKQPRRLT